MISSLMAGTHLVTLSLGLAFVLLLFYSPLRSKAVQFIQYWHSRNVLKGPTSFVHDLHVHKKQHIVRLGHNEFSITDPALLSTIYADKDFVKSDQYAAFDFEGETSLFSMRDPEEHQRRAKAVRGMFRPTEVSDKADIIEAGIDRMVECLDQVVVSGTAINVLDLARGMAIETISLYAFKGRYMGTERLSMLDVGHSIGLVLEDINHSAVFGQSKAWLIQRFRSLGAAITSIIATEPRQSEALREAWQKYTSYTQELAGSQSSSATYHAHLASLDVSRQSLETEIADLLFAGTDSTATTIATALWYIYNDNVILQQLREDLEYVDDTLLATRPYLNAVIDETLRVAPPVPRRLPRIVPYNKDIFYAEDKHNDEWHKILPAGSTVGISAYSLHRDPVFENANDFIPERWLEQDQVKRERMRECFIPFGRGVRACIGQALARQEIRLVIRRIVERYDGEALGNEPEFIDNFNASVVAAAICPKLRRRKT